MRIKFTRNVNINSNINSIITNIVEIMKNVPITLVIRPSLVLVNMTYKNKFNITTKKCIDTNVNNDPKIPKKIPITVIRVLCEQSITKILNKIIKIFQQIIIIINQKTGRSSLFINLFQFLN